MTKRYKHVKEFKLYNLYIPYILWDYENVYNNAASGLPNPTPFFIGRGR